MNRKNQNKSRKTLIALLILSVTFALPACGEDHYYPVEVQSADSPKDPSRGGDESGDEVAAASIEYVTATCNGESASLDLTGSLLNTSGLSIEFRHAGATQIVKAVEVSSDESVTFSAADQVSLSIETLDIDSGDYDVSLRDDTDTLVSSTRAYIPTADEVCDNNSIPVIYSVSHECNGSGSSDAVIHGQNLALVVGEELYTALYVQDAEVPHYSQTLDVEDMSASWEISENSIRVPMPVDSRTRTYQVNVARNYSNELTVSVPSLETLDCASKTNSGTMTLESVSVVCAETPGQYRLVVNGAGFFDAETGMEEINFHFEMVDPYGAEWDTAFTDFGPAVVIANDAQIVLQVPYAEYDLEKNLRLTLENNDNVSNPITFLVPVGADMCGSTN